MQIILKLALVFATPAVFAAPGVASNTGGWVNISCVKTAQGRSSLYKSAGGNLALNAGYEQGISDVLKYVESISTPGRLKNALPDGGLTIRQYKGARPNGSCYNYCPAGDLVEMVSGSCKKGFSDYEFAVRRFSHELGHKIGQQVRNNGTVYDQYFRATGGKCLISSYGSSKRNEEFADVFRAVIFDINAVKKISPTCAKAADFFANYLGIQPGNNGCSKALSTASLSSSSNYNNYDSFNNRSTYSSSSYNGGLFDWLGALMGPLTTYNAYLAQPQIDWDPSKEQLPKTQPASQSGEAVQEVPWGGDQGPNN